MLPSTQQFIHQCQLSTRDAYHQFKQLLDSLDQPSSRGQASRLLHQLAREYSVEAPRNCHFQFLNQKILDENDRIINLVLLQFPSTFLPEEWSFTFYEGLVRYPANEYNNKNVIELGCGIGWISIALARRYSLQTMVGLDINPKAITCARLNVYLNGVDDQGEDIIDSQAQPLRERVKFYESNLLSHFKHQTSIIDKVIGCIPQVLSPDPAVMELSIEETASDEYLQSLSNYAVKQGFLEDQFGLGLIASAVEQAIPLLAANAKLILNLGGRPGRAVIERVMQRRGFEVRRIWQTQVEQAADTEIDALAEIEKNSDHRFEFYMSTDASTPISARTALAYAKSGGKIFHSVDVYEAALLFPEKVKSIFNSIQLMDSDDNPQAIKNLSSAIDLTYDNVNDAEERYSFLAFFANFLSQLKNFPYESAAGLHYFRQQLIEYFQYYLKLEVNQESLLITPGRKELISNIVDNYKPQLILVAKSLSYLIDKDKDNVTVLETPSKVEYLVELIRNLRPQIVISQLNSDEIQASRSVQQLIECSIENDCLLVVDITNNFDLSSQPNIHGVYQYLAKVGLPNNLILMAALTNNRVYNNYTLNIALSNNPLLVSHLIDAAELSYSRTPVLKQYYYGHLLEELLFFQRSRAINVIDRGAESSTSLSLLLSQSSKQAFSHPAIQGNHLRFDSDTIRLDYGENELAAPSLLKESLFESYLTRHTLLNVNQLKSNVGELLQRRFNLPGSVCSNVVFGNGVAPIYSALLKLSMKDSGRLVMPSGSYGYFRSSASYHGVAVETINTGEKNAYKLNVDDINSLPSSRSNRWLFLNAPVVNPTGAVYSECELAALLDAAFNNNMNVIIDSVFSGLEYDLNSNYDLGIAFNKFAVSKKCSLILIGGISKEFASGGLRFAYAWSSSTDLLGELDSELISKPHDTLAYSVNKLFLAQNSSNEQLKKHLAQQVKVLASRADALAELLESKAWKVLPPLGGLFLVAKPEGFIQQRQCGLVEGGDLASELLLSQFNIAINNSSWTGLPGYCRFVLSCSGNSFSEALCRLNGLNG